VKLWQLSECPAAYHRPVVPHTAPTVTVAGMYVTGDD
jgi:hypothetical protein